MKRYIQSASMLNEFQSEMIKSVRRQIRNLGLKDWMIEGYDTGLDIIFNNDLDVSLIVDYNGNIVSNPYNIEITDKLKKLAMYNARIHKICGDC